MSPKPASVDEYLASVPESHRATLAALRASIKALVPETVESIGYGIPAYKYHGRPLVYFAAAKNHCALYGLDAELAKEAGFEADKGTIRFPPDAPPPEAFVKTLLEQRVAGIDAAEDAKKQKPRKTAG